MTLFALEFCIWPFFKAYYYYLTEAGKNYEDTLLDVYNDAQIRQIPYRMILLDSWWYEKGRMGGVRNWTAMPQIFPNGLQYLFEKTNWNFIAHNRYWSSDNVYAAQNGGLYEFIIDEEMHSAMPQDEAFWDELFKTSYQWSAEEYKGEEGHINPICDYTETRALVFD